MNSSTASGEIMSLVDLLTKNKIEIPIIQRDYAQGRKENSLIRRDFMLTLKSRILANKVIKLDFVYGEVIDDVFQPLDGQQRLTTLFLLHWYAIAKKGPIPAETAGLLSRFTYETRISSRDFCNDLISKSIMIEGNGKISEKIIDANWFYLSWKQDPSINAMLNTIDDIDDIFSDVSDLWASLADKKIIRFHFLNLQDLGLSDDLYIKMNARGKLLTPYENFKAQIQKLIEENKWEENYSQIDKFEFKIDTIWTDFFWFKYREKTDEAHIKFFTAIIMSKVVFMEPPAERHNILQALNENAEGRSLLEYINHDNYEYIYRCYDIYSMGDKESINLDISSIKFWNHDCEGSVLDQIANNSSSYTQKVIFYAQTEYLIRNEKFNRDAYLNWMRVIRNFVCFGNVYIGGGTRSDLVRDPDSFSSMIALVNNLAGGSGDIYYFLSNFNASEVSYRKEQLAEEINKAKKILQYPEIREIIWKLEDLNLFKGRISFAFDCSDRMSMEKYRTEKDKLEDLYGIFYTLFNNEPLGTDFNRTMFTIDIEGEYKFYDYWWSYWHAGKAYKRKLILKLNDLEYLINGEHRVYFLELLLHLLEKDYKRIIDDFNPPIDMPNWKKRLIKEDGLIDSPFSGFFAVCKEEKTCYLLKTQRPGTIDGGIPIV